MILNRDDIPDALILSSACSVIAVLAFLISKIGAKNTGKTAKDEKK
jgi:hypothetical protein